MDVNQEMAAVGISGSYLGFSRLYPDNMTGFSLLSQTRSSFIRAYLDPGLDSVYPSSTLIVTAEDGLVKSIVFDSSCNTCQDTSSTCRESSYGYTGLPAGDKGTTKACFFGTGACDATSVGLNATVCDLLVYVTFAGTDVDGRVLRSSEARQSTFTEYDWFGGFPDFSNPAGIL